MYNPCIQYSSTHQYKYLHCTVNTPCGIKSGGLSESPCEVNTIVWKYYQYLHLNLLLIVQIVLLRNNHAQ